MFFARGSVEKDLMYEVNLEYILQYILLWWPGDNSMINYKILAVDDDPIIVKIVEISLKSKGYQVRLATNGCEAIEALHDENFDLIITDLEMGDPDGIAVLRKAKFLNPRQIGVVMTGNHDVSQAIRAIRAGVDDYLLKPFSLTEVFDCVKRSIDKLEVNQKSPPKDAEVFWSPEQNHVMMPMMSNAMSGKHIVR